MNILDVVAKELNIMAKNHPVGRLQYFRKENGGLSRLPSKQLFDLRTVFEGYGYHYGGRKELQFNIGIEGNKLRFGVAFSLECSQSLPSIDILIPKIALFNEFISEHAQEYSDLRMWHYQESNRSQDYMPSQIPQELVCERTFIFLGTKQNLDSLDYPEILRVLDRLYSMYMFTEEYFPKNSTQNTTFEFKSGCSIKLSNTSANLKSKRLNVVLRHNDMQHKLYNELAKKFGSDNVGTEISIKGGSIDLVVKNGDEFWFYEIKTASSAQSCIRQALGQILEYSFWPGNQRPARLFIVGTMELNESEAEYLKLLQSKFNLPLAYQAVNA